MSSDSIEREELLGLFLWLMFRRCNGIAKFSNDEILSYPGMKKMQVAASIENDGITLFVVEPEYDTMGTTPGPDGEVHA